MSSFKASTLIFTDGLFLFLTGSSLFPHLTTVIIPILNRFATSSQVKPSSFFISNTLLRKSTEYVIYLFSGYHESIIIILYGLCYTLRLWVDETHAAHGSVRGIRKGTVIDRVYACLTDLTALQEGLSRCLDRVKSILAETGASVATLEDRELLKDANEQCEWVIAEARRMHAIYQSKAEHAPHWSVDSVDLVPRAAAAGTAAFDAATAGGSDLALHRLAQAVAGDAELRQRPQDVKTTLAFATQIARTEEARPGVKMVFGAVPVSPIAVSERLPAAGALEAALADGRDPPMHAFAQELMKDPKTRRAPADATVAYAGMVARK